MKTTIKTKVIENVKDKFDSGEFKKTFEDFGEDYIKFEFGIRK